VLLLFDIDGTLLLRASEPHRRALLEALTRVYGLVEPGDQDVAAAGRTDTQIAREIALKCGLPVGRFDASLPDFQSACSEAFERHCPDDLRSRLAPGIERALGVLAGRSAFKLALLTGNYEPIARLKLERAGIGRHFQAGQGAFGSDAEQRELLGPIARARAGGLASPYPRELTVIIGDTPLDIACARADGLRIIAVATGPYPPQALSQADAVAANGYELAPLVDRLAAAARVG